MGSQYFAGIFSQSTPQACLVDLTPPTFSGITGLTANANGSLTASWSAATDATNPVGYQVFIQASTATGLFSSGNKLYSAIGTSVVIFTDALLAPLVNGTTYFVGIRAVDAVGNVDTNTASISAISNGVADNSLANKLDTLLARLTSTRAGYMDNLPNLDVAVSTRATQTSVDNIQNNTTFVGVVPSPLILPASGAKVYKIYAILKDTQGAQEDPDSNILNYRIEDTAGGVVVATTAMTRTSVGQYEASYTVNSSDSERALVVFFEYTENSVAFKQVRVTEVQEFESKLDTLISRLTPTRASNLDNLDVAVSTRATQASVNTANTSLNDIKGVGWNSATDTLRTIRQAIDDDYAGIIFVLNQITGIGFVSSVDSLKQISSGLGATITAANNAESAAIAAAAATATKSSQASVDALAVSIAAIPTNPVLATDPHLTNIDVPVSSRASAVVLGQIAGPTFNPVLDNLHEIKLAIDGVSSSTGDAQESTLVTIYNLLTTKASQASANTIQSIVAAIPNNPLLTNDSRLNNLDATISSRATQADLLAIQGIGFSSSYNSLKVITDLIGTLSGSLDISPIMIALDEMKGSGFSSPVDSLKDLNDIAKTERAQILGDVEALLSTGVPV